MFCNLLVYAVIYWNSKHILPYLTVASTAIVAASVPFLWLSGKAAIVCLVLSVFCLVPIPVYFGIMALE